MNNSEDRRQWALEKAIQIHAESLKDFVPSEATTRIKETADFLYAELIQDFQPVVPPPSENLGPGFRHRTAVLQP